MRATVQPIAGLVFGSALALAYEAFHARSVLRRFVPTGTVPLVAGYCAQAAVCAVVPARVVEVGRTVVVVVEVGSAAAVSRGVVSTPEKSVPVTRRPARFSLGWAD